MSRILLVEDHERLAGLVCKGLVAAGIAVDLVDAAWATIPSSAPTPIATAC